jgi:hypothetical protein
VRSTKIGPQDAHQPVQGRVKPDKSLNLISDEWGDIEFEGETLANALGKFGTWTVREQVVAP